MKAISATYTPAPPPLQKGQIWEMTESNIQIKMVGKRLVHYKQFKGKITRATTSLASIVTLEKYLADHQAVLTQMASPVVGSPVVSAKA